MNRSKSHRGGATLESYTIRPIGYVQSLYAQTNDVPHTHTGWTAEISHIRLLPKYAKGLGGLTGYSHIIVLFWVHRSKEWKMPKNHHKPPHVKIFATRMPVRPNPVGMSVVELIDFSTETGEVAIKGLDALDGTPVLDIKPYIPNFDSCAEAEVPDWVMDHLRSHHHGGHTHHDEKTSKDTGRNPSGH
ncbi:MAG: tRNA (N6-threonylcarbamoyladenosine(37)-N6)-methyltransferase TrmO [Planctomycetes bacterium]|nr:tRNA (N6-threonylcarbamoyladenosine(37)-N6)-methyltransferase TrmO [Planctomycetota bacterium]